MTKLEAKLKYYEDVATEYGYFRKWCEKNGLNIDDFEKTKVDERIFEYANGKTEKRNLYIFVKKTTDTE